MKALLFVCTFAVFASLPSATAADTLNARMAEFVAPLNQDVLLSGNLIIATTDDLLFAASYGMSNYELYVPVTFDTRFCVASLSKSMTGLAVAVLIDRGKLDLQSPVSTWIDSFPRGDEVTLEMLMRHTAGVPHRVTEPIEETVPTTAMEVVERVKKNGLAHEPGAKRTYSTAGYSVVARIIEIVTGQDYDTAMRDLVFAPLGMNDTRHIDGRANVPHRASPYIYGPDGMENAPLKDLSFLIGGGSMTSTAVDILILGRACMTRSGLPASVWKIFTDQLGWMSSNEVGWTGMTNGFGTFLDMYLEKNLIVVYTGNTALGGAGKVRDAVVALVEGGDYDVPEAIPPTASIDDERLREYVGAYGTASVEMRSGSLFTTRGVLRPIGTDRFYSLYYGCDVVFERDGGSVSAMAYVGDGRTYWRAERTN